MIRITFPYLILVSLAGMVAAIMQVFGKFTLPAFTPVLLNLSIILAAIYLSPHIDIPIKALAWGVIIGGVLQLTILLPSLRKLGLVALPKVSFKDKNVRRVIITMLPILLSVSVTQVSMAVDTMLATWLDQGTVTWLYLANRLIGLPLGVLGVSIAVVVLPSLAKSYSKKNNEEFHKSVGWGLHCMMFLGLPACAALLVMTESLVITLFNYKEFGYFDVVYTSIAVRCYAIGLLAFMAIKILTSASLAHFKERIPMRCAIIASISNIVMSLIFMQFIGFAGLALSTSLSAMLNVLLLFILLSKNNVYKPPVLRGVLLSMRYLLASIAMAVLLFYMQGPAYAWQDYSVTERITQVVFMVVSGACVYFAVLFITGWRFRHIKQ